MGRLRGVLRIVLGGSLGLMVLICHAQTESTEGSRRIGVLASSAVAASDLAQWPTPLLEGLRERGWVEGKNLIVERRAPSPGASAGVRLAAELVEAKVEVIVTIGTPAALAARGATSTIPIVMATIGDPVSAGLVTNLSRPGGNITGNTFIEPDVAGKRLQILKELLPGLRQVGELINPDNPAMRMLQAGEATALRELGINVFFADASTVDALEPAIAELSRLGAQALIVHSDSLYVANRQRIMELARRYHLPPIGEGRQFVAAGAILSYAPDSAVMTRNAASFVDRILKGARAGDLPIERPTRFDLVINPEAAEAFGITIPRSILVRADASIPPRGGKERARP